MPRDVPVIESRLSPNARVQEIGSGARSYAQVAQEVSRVAQQQANLYQQKAQENAALKGQIDLSRKLDEINKQYPNDPKGMEEAINAYSEGFLSEVDDETTALRYELQITRASQNMLSVAGAKQQAIIDDEARENNLLHMNELERELGQIAPNLTSGNDSVALSAAERLAESTERFMSSMNATNAAGQPLFSAAQRVAKIEGFKQTAFTSAAISYVESQPNKMAAFNDIKEGRLSFDMPNEEGGFERVVLAETLDPASMRSIEAATNGQIAEQQRVEKLRLTDPVRYLNETRGLGRPSDLVMAQVDMGVPPTRARVLSNDQAKQMATSLMQAESTQQVVLMKQQIKEQYGEFALNAVNDLTQAGLSKDFSYMMQMDDVDHADVQELLFEYVVAPDSVKDVAKQRLSAEGYTSNDLQTNLANEMAETATLLLGEGKSTKFVSGLYDSALGIAQNHYAKYGDMDEAITKATDWIMYRSQAVEVNGKTIRIPEEYDSGQIEGAAQDILETVPFIVPANSSILSNLTADQIRETARWVPNDEGTGLVLVSDMGEPLVAEDGQLVERLFSELMEHSVEKEVTREDLRQRSAEQTREQLRRIEESDFLFPSGQ